MTTKISAYIDVLAKIRDLGCEHPEGLSILPVNFESATSTDEFRQLSETSTVKTLLRNNGIPFSEVRQEKPAYIQNNAFEWIAPTLFVSASLLTQNPETISVSLSVIANYPICCINLRRETVALPGIAAFPGRVLNFPILT